MMINKAFRQASRIRFFSGHRPLLTPKGEDAASLVSLEDEQNIDFLLESPTVRSKVAVTSDFFFSIDEAIAADQRSYLANDSFRNEIERPYDFTTLTPPEETNEQNSEALQDNNTNTVVLANEDFLVEFKADQTKTVLPSPKKTMTNKPKLTIVTTPSDDEEDVNGSESNTLTVSKNKLESDRLQDVGSPPVQFTLNAELSGCDDKENGDDDDTLCLLADGNQASHLLSPSNNVLGMTLISRTEPNASKVLKHHTKGSLKTYDGDQPMKKYSLPSKTNVLSEDKDGVLVLETPTIAKVSMKDNVPEWTKPGYLQSRQQRQQRFIRLCKHN
jgi:hypothetical protein